MNGQPYSAATDISVSGLSQTQIRNLLEKLAKVGFAAWYRQSGHDGWSGVNHIHAVYANCKMKSSLRSQVRSWLAGRNGLVSNTIYHFHTWSAAAKATVKAKWEMSHEGTTNGGAGVGGRVNTAGIALNIRANASTTAAIVGSVPDGCVRRDHLPEARHVGEGHLRHDDAVGQDQRRLRQRRIRLDGLGRPGRADLPLRPS